MSEISIYDIVPTPKLADKLIGTSVGGVIEDVTYNFTLQELLQLFIPNIPANTLQGVLDYGNTATQDINLTGTINTTDLNVLATANILDSVLTGETHVEGELFDGLDSKGTAGQVLTSTGSGVEWYTIPTVIPTLQQVLESGNTSDVSIILTANITAVTATASNVVSSTSLSVNGTLKDGTAAVGSSNQILSSTGSGVRWVDMPVYNVISPLLYDTPTKTFSIQVANSSQGGYLSSADWINFDGKQDAIILTTAGTSGAATFVGNTLNIPVYTPDLSGYVPISRTLTINGVTYDLSANRSWTIPAGVADVTATSPLFSSGGAYPDISIQVANATQGGYLSSADWNTFNNKGSGTLSSVGVSMPSAFSVANSPLTANGTIAITGAGTISEYIRGDGSLAAFPALTGYVPYTGATTNVDLGEFGITSGYVGFDLTPTATPTAVGTMYWDAFYRTVSLNDGDGDTTLQIGQEERLLIHNNTGATLTDGQVVYVTGSTGELPSVSLANASSESTSAATLGVVTESIANGADGFVTVSGIVHGLNTLAYTEGDLLWLSDTAGQFTNIKPISPSHLVLIGYVIKRAGGNGSILVKIQNTQELSESSDVLISAPEIDGQGLFLQTISGVQLWRNRSISDVIGGSPITGSGTTNYVPKFTSASSIGDSNIQDDGSLITLGSNSYVNGALGVGVSPSTGFNLSVQRNFTGASISYGIASLGQIQSDVTTARYFYSSSSQASGASTTSIQHFFATQGTFLGTTTSQIGFYVSSTLIGATSNFAFRSDIDLGTNRWNLYMVGTANNYLAGSLGIGTASLTGYNLRIGKTITGATSAFGINQDSAIQSDVTSGAIAYGTILTTQAASFTLGSLYHFRAQQGTFGSGSAVTLQIGYDVASSLVSASQNIGFRSLIPSSLNNYNLLLSGTAANYLAGDVAIGVSSNYASSGPILTSTLTNGGSGYVDGTYTDVTSGTATTGSGTNALFTVVISGGIVTSATLTWGGSSYRVGDTLTISNTLLGGSGSGLIITVNTVDSSQLKITNASGGDITLFRNDTTLTAGDNLGTIKWESNDSTAKASGLQAKIGAFGASTNGGAYLSFLTRSATAGTSLVEAMRIGSEGQVGIGATTLTGYNLRVSKNITGAVSSNGVFVDGTIQSDVTTAAIGYGTILTTQAASFTLGSLYHFRAQQTTLGAGSTVNLQVGFDVANTLTGATQNIAFRSLLNAGTNVWNLYMNGTASNYLAGSLGIGNTSVAVFNLRVDKNVTGGTTAYGGYFGGNVQSDVTSQMFGVMSSYGTQATTFTLSNLYNFHVVQGTFGAGSTVTNQHGFSVASSLIGATNNYGFRGQIASGTGRWNLYMDGTAQNYLAGALSIGVTTANASALFQVDSTTKGFLPPRMTAAQRAAIGTPAEGLVVVQTDGTQGLYLYIGAAWHALTML